MRWTVRVIGAVVMAAVVGIVSILFLPANRVAQIAADQLRLATGRQVTISGDVALRFWPVLGLRAGGLEVGNAGWSRQGPMLSASNASIGVDAMSLLHGEIRIRNITADAPTIRLEQRRDGRASWQFTDGGGAASIATETTPERAARPITIERLEVTNAKLIYDAEGSDLVSYSGVDLTLDWPQHLGPADIRAVVRPAGDAVTVAATIQGFGGFITSQVRPLVAEISSSAGRILFEGRASIDGSVAGALSLRTDDTAAFLGALGMGAAELPQGLGQTLDVTTDLTLTPDRRLALRDLKADLGGNRVTGDADIGLNGVPQVNARLDAGALDLNGGAGGGGSAGTGSGPVSGWSTVPIDVSGLAAFNGDIALRAQSVAVGNFALGESHVLLRNDGSRLSVELQDVSAYSGKLSGEVVLNNRNGVSVGGKLAARGVSIQPLLKDAAGLSRLSGQGNAQVSFLGVGASVDEILRSLSGEGKLRLGKGMIEGFNLNRLMKSGEIGGGTTIFDSFAATFAITAGVLRNDDLLLLLADYEARGEGTVDLGRQRIDYLFTPVATRANGGRGVAIPVRVVGPWSDPMVQPDLSAAIELNFGKEKKNLEKRARKEVKKKLRDELGIVQKDGQSLEDAARDKAQDALGQELLKLLK